MNRRYIGGTLSQLNEVRSYPTLAGRGDPVQPRKVAAQKQTVYILDNGDRPVGMASFNLICAYLVSRFHEDEGHHHSEKNLLAASIAGVIGNCGDWGSLRPWTKMTTAYKTGGIETEFVTITTEELKEKATTDSRFKSFLTQWETDLEYILSKTNMFFVLAMSLVLSLFKNLGEANYNPWFKRRILTFSGTVGDVYTPLNVTEDQYPLMSEVQALFSFMSANHPIRKAVYLEILALAKGSPNFISKSFAEIHHLVRGHELNHLIMIDKYIIQEHPELLKTVMLRGLSQRFCDAISFLRRFDSTEQMYVKLLQDKDVCALTNRKIFSEAAIIATAIAEFKNSTFENYYHDKSPSARRLRDRVLDYLNVRYNLVNIAAGGHDKKTMDSKEYEVFLEKALEQLDQYEKEESDDSDIFQGLQLPTSHLQSGV